jgi:hypothetical protein
LARGARNSTIVVVDKLSKTFGITNGALLDQSFISNGTVRGAKALKVDFCDPRSFCKNITRTIMRNLDYPLSDLKAKLARYVPVRQPDMVGLLPLGSADLDGALGGGLACGALHLEPCMSALPQLVQAMQQSLQVLGLALLCGLPASGRSSGFGTMPQMKRLGVSTAWAWPISGSILAD